jgi:hypothetical protein
MGDLEYVIESRHDGNVETWFVVRPHHDLADQYAALGVVLSPHCRVVVEAESLRPVGYFPKTFLSRRRQRVQSLFRRASP